MTRLINLSKEILHKAIYSLVAVIIITASAGHVPVQAQSQILPEYVVQSGDSLYAIALQFHTTLDALIAANGITEDNVLNIGDLDTFLSLQYRMELGRARGAGSEIAREINSRDDEIIPNALFNIKE